jgi:hypothetical protein
MKTEKIRKYCIVGMDNVEGLELDVNKLSESSAKFLIGQKKVGMVGLFESKLDPDQIKNKLNKGNGRSFFLSELNAATFAVHVDEDIIHNMFFGEFDEEQKVYGRIKRSVLDFIASGFTDSLLNETDLEYDEQQLSSLSVDQRGTLMDKLLTNVDKLTDNQKKALNFLASL